MSNIIGACWGVFFVVWIVAALFTKRTAYHENASRRFRYIIPIVTAWYFLFRASRLAYPFNLPIIPDNDAVRALAAILCVSGLGFCLWARAVLGRNWSGTVTVKENHELIVRGPYRIVRHPIYTGVLGMLMATAIEQRHVAGLIAVILVFIGLWIKSADEEQVMTKQFPDEYPAYRKQVKRIIPFVL